MTKTDQILSIRRAVLITNRTAHRGESSLESVKDRLRRSGIRLIDERTEEPEEIPERILQHRDAEAVLLAGGDGTLNTAAEALLEIDRPLGVLPLGTANNLARTLGIPLNPAEAVEVIIAGHSRRIDLGWANEKAFFTVAHIGLGAEVIRRASSNVKRRWGVLGLVGGLVRASRRSPSFRARIHCDGSIVSVTSMQIAVGNGRRYGALFRVAANAGVDDCRLHLYSLRPRGLLGLVMLAPALATGRYGGRSGVYRVDGETIRIETDRRLPVATDGEITGCTPVTFRVLPRALCVLVPRAKE